MAPYVMNDFSVKIFLNYFTHFVVLAFLAIFCDVEFLWSFNLPKQNQQSAKLCGDNWKWRRCCGTISTGLGCCFQCAGRGNTHTSRGVMQAQSSLCPRSFVWLTNIWIDFSLLYWTLCQTPFVNHTHLWIRFKNNKNNLKSRVKRSS